MSKEHDLVIIAAYTATELATKDFDQLVKLVMDKKIKTRWHDPRPEGYARQVKCRARLAITSAAKGQAGAAVSACL